MAPFASVSRFGRGMARVLARVAAYADAFSSARVLLASLCAAAQAKEAPLLEYGLGVGAVAFEDYRGSDSMHVYPCHPYVVYNGKFLKADREGVRGTCSIKTGSKSI